MYSCTLFLLDMAPLPLSSLAIVGSAGRCMTGTILLFFEALWTSHFFHTCDHDIDCEILLFYLLFIFWMIWMYIWLVSCSLEMRNWNLCRRIANFLWFYCLIMIWWKLQKMIPAQHELNVHLKGQSFHFHMCNYVRQIDAQTDMVVAMAKHIHTTHSIYWQVITLR